MSLNGVAEKAVQLNANKVIVIDRWKGGLGEIRFFRIGHKGFTQVTSQIYI